MERNFIFENEKGIFDLIENKGVLIDIPNIPLSQRRFETKEIDGKNGTYTIDKKTYKIYGEYMPLKDEYVITIYFIDNTRSNYEIKCLESN